MAKEGKEEGSEGGKVSERMWGSRARSKSSSSKRYRP
jgi:hypothetical protein